VGGGISKDPEEALHKIRKATLFALLGISGKSVDLEPGRVTRERLVNQLSSIALEACTPT